MTPRGSTTLAFAALAFVCPPACATGQQLPTALRAAATDSERIHRHLPATYWVEGATIGAAIVGTTGAWIGHEFSCDSDSGCSTADVVVGGLVSGLAGGIVGGLIGGAFSAPHPRPFRGHPVQAAITGAAFGALWSFGLLLQGCTGGCGSEEVVFGVSTTAIGALAGFLLGN